MQDFTIDEIIKAVGGTCTCSNAEKITGVVIDSREAKDGTLFVPIKGENADGHSFIEKAFENGAAAVLSEADIEAARPVIRVKSTVCAIGDLAYAYKQKYNVPTVAITGSVGKTGTKDMVASVMAKLGPCLKTKGNFNNELGLPLTVFNLSKEHKSCVLEMGMSAFGEIHRLADIARADVAVISNIGMSHIENLGSREGILKAKLEIADFFGEDNLLIINADNDMLSGVDRNKKYKILTFGIENDADYRAENICDMGFSGIKFTAVTPKQKFDVTLSALGVHNVLNALSAIAVGEHFGISGEDIRDALSDYDATAMRLTVEKHGNVTVINDCYNASPDSILASLDVLKKASGRRIAVLGDVLELGSFAKEAHRGIGKACFGRCDILITAGENARFIKEEAEKCGVTAEYYPSADEASKAVCDIIIDGDTVLVKASRGMKFEKICESIEDKLR